MAQYLTALDIMTNGRYRQAIRLIEQTQIYLRPPGSSMLKSTGRSRLAELRDMVIVVITPGLNGVENVGHNP